MTVWDDRTENMFRAWQQSRVDEIVALGVYVEVDIMDRLHMIAETPEQQEALRVWMESYNYEYARYAESPDEPRYLWSDLIECGTGLIGFVVAMQDPNVRM